jgi:hypothetical protein
MAVAHHNDTRPQGACNSSIPACEGVRQKNTALLRQWQQLRSWGSRNACAISTSTLCDHGSAGTCQAVRWLPKHAPAVLHLSRHFAVSSPPAIDMRLCLRPMRSSECRYRMHASGVSTSSQPSGCVAHQHHRNQPPMKRMQSGLSTWAVVAECASGVEPCTDGTKGAGKHTGLRYMASTAARSESVRPAPDGR